MSLPSDTVPFPSPPIPPSSPQPTSSPSHPVLDASLPPHDDFLGASSDPNELQELGISFDDDSYSFGRLTNDSGLLTDLTPNPTTVHPADFTSSWSLSQYSTDSLLFSNTYLADLSLSASPSSASALALQDRYFPHASDSFYGTATTADAINAHRNVPQIHVETEFSHLSAHSQSYDPHSPYSHSSPSRSPAGVLATPSPFPYGQSSVSPSSIGSAPPFTPQTPYSTVSPRPSPFIGQSSASPISPPYIVRHPVPFDPIKADTLSIPIPREVGGVIEIAAAIGHPLGCLFVPQKVYKPHTLSDRRRYVDEVQLEAPIMFYTHNPTGCGIPLRDAIGSRFSSLEGRDDPMFQGRGPSVSIRLNWPGYAPWSRQIPTRDFRSPPHPITRAKLARNVAKTIQRFVQEMESKAMEDVSEVKWRVGARHIRMEDLILVGLQHVSMGSWQAHVRLIRPH